MSDPVARLCADLAALWGEAMQGLHEECAAVRDRLGALAGELRIADPQPGESADAGLHDPILAAGHTDLQAARRRAAQLGLTPEQIAALYPDAG